MKKTTPTPHDAVFKTFLKHPETVRDFMALHLPAEILALCDLSSLKLEAGSFVEDDLRHYASDILWSMKTTAGEDGYIHLLVEHQSSPDKNMAFRQMRYAIAAMQRPLEAGHKKLPWLFRCCSMPAGAARIRTPQTGWTVSVTGNRPKKCTRGRFRWLMSPLSMMMR